MTEYAMLIAIEEPTAQFPIGSALTWENITLTMAHNPKLLMSPWAWDEKWVMNSTAGCLFVQFMTNYFLTLSEDVLRHSKPPKPKDLKEAMELWSMQSLTALLIDVSFKPSNNGLLGNVTGRRNPSFKDMVHSLKQQALNTKLTMKVNHKQLKPSKHCTSETIIRASGKTQINLDGPLDGDGYGCAYDALFTIISFNIYRCQTLRSRKNIFKDSNQHPSNLHDGFQKYRRDVSTLEVARGGVQDNNTVLYLLGQIGCSVSAPAT
jgi:hypothetical protein